MCWFGNRNDKRVAKKDIRCKKVFLRKLNQEGYIRKHYVSPVMKSMYVQGKTYESNIRLSYMCDVWKIDEGIHCYNFDRVVVEKSTSESGKRLIAKVPFATDAYGQHYLCTYYGDDLHFEAVLLECIIPKGTTYYENNQGEIVTEKLILGEEITKIDNYKQ